jgi:hypothetical protein
MTSLKLETGDLFALLDGKAVHLPPQPSLGFSASASEDDILLRARLTEQAMNEQLKFMRKWLRTREEQRPQEDLPTAEQLAAGRR